MTGVPSFAQILAQVESIRERYPDARAIGIGLPALDESATGPPTLRIGAEELPVIRCRSVLALRERLVDLPAAGPPLVVLTDLPATELGEDLRARLAHRKLFSIEAWQLVKERFKAQYVDPRLAERHEWAARALLDAEPEAGYPPVPSGFLDAETAWRRLFESLAGIPRGERDPEALLAWALDGEPVKRLGALPEAVRTGLAAAAEDSAGRTARAILECAGRLGRRAVSVGLVARVLFDADGKGDERAARARGKLEALLGLHDLDAALARGWTAAAERVVRHRLAPPAEAPPVEAQEPSSPGAMEAVLADADDLIRTLGAEELAGRSAILRASLEQRLADLARELAAFVGGEGRELPDTLRDAAGRVPAGRVPDHALARGEPYRADGVEMAPRLAGPPDTLRDAAGRAPDHAIPGEARRADGVEMALRPSGLPDTLRDAAGRVLDHALAPGEPRRADGVEMALRLSGWLAARRAGDVAGRFGDTAGRHPSDDAAGPRRFGEAARGYAREGGFVDRARARLWDGDPSPPVAEAYAALAQQADEARQQENREFGALLAGWPGAAPHERSLLGVEAVLDRCVAPLARAQPVLLLVIDAMSMAVFRELDDDLVRRGWIELVTDDAPDRPVVVAALPTVTEVSRTSLLCGAVTSGNAAKEKDGFSRHDGLRSACTPGAPPVLFHKGDLREAGAAGVSPRVAEAVADPDRRVVGVVINAVDDHLAKGDQVRVPWTARHIRPLEELLEACRAGGRVVVLASDHGHVLERGTTLRDVADAAERWRPAAGTPADDEVLLHGPRVVAEGRRVLAPWSERVRFGMKKNGYHGGATPQEAVLPLGVFALPETTGPLAGWREAGPDEPAWWRWRAEAAAPPASAAPTPDGAADSAAPTPDGAADPALAGPDEPPTPAPARRPTPPGETGDLFAALEPEPPRAATTWIDRLFETDLFAEQRRQAARTALPDERIRAILTALDARGGKLTGPALAESLGVPLFRLGGIVSALRRVLNVDGYAVLSVDESSETVELNRDLLDAQFGLAGDDAREPAR